MCFNVFHQKIDDLQNCVKTFLEKHEIKIFYTIKKNKAKLISSLSGMPLVSTLSSTAKGAKPFIPHLKSRRNNRRYKETKLHILWTLTFTLWHKSVVLWKGCCLWGLQPARRLFLRSADNTAGALQLPGTPGSRNIKIHSDGTTL